MKKFFAFLLTFAMLFSLAMPAMAAEGDTATVYFQNNWQWTDVRAYIHYTDGTENAAYPGVAMTFHENDGTYDVYSVTFPVSNIDYIIFSGIKDDGSGARDATPQIPSSELYRNATYYCMWNDGNTYGREGGEGESLDSAAAPSGPSITGGTTGDVSASFNPEITISGIRYSGETVTYDENSGNYVYLIPADFSDFETDYIPVIITISGTNLEYAADEEEVLLGVNFHMEDQTQSLTLKLSDAFAEGFAYQNGSLVLDPNTIGDGLTMAYSFSNDNGGTWSDPVTLVYKQAYSITNNTAADANGTITVPEEAAAGDTVTVNVSPVENYGLNKLTVTDASGNPVTVENNSFTMPASAVTVSATFKYTGSYDITINGSDNGTVTADLNKATAGTTVTLTVAPADDYRLATLTVNDGAVEVTKVNDTTYTFVMPGADVTVNAVFEKIPHAITIDENIANGTVDADLDFAVEGSTVTLTVTPDTGYQIGTVTVKDADGKTVDFTETGVASGKYTFTMPASAVTVTATFEAIPITSAEITWGNMSFTYYDTVDEDTGEEMGWTPADEEGAGTVTVKNTGDTTFTAQASYESTTAEYGTFTGTFNPASSKLTAGNSYTFTLKLEGKPTKAIPAGTKIGQVTITINESAEG